MRPATSIRRKVALVLFGITGLAMAAAGAALWIFEYRAADLRARATLESLAETMTPGLLASLDFDTPAVAAENLQRLESGGIVVAATVFRTFPDSTPPQLFAAYLRPGRRATYSPQPGATGFTRQGDRALLNHILRSEGQPIAVLQLEADVGPFRRSLHESLVILALVIALVGTASIWLTRLLQRTLTRPLLQLAATVTHVRTRGDYSARAEVATRDEVGHLAEGFNLMLAGIEQRDRQLAEQSAFQQAVLENAGVSIISTDTTGVIRSFNTAAERMLGYRRDEIVGRETAMRYLDAAEVSRRATELGLSLGRTIKPDFGFFVELTREAPSALEWIHIRKDGIRIPVFVVLSTLRAPDGRYLGLCAIGTDLTERKAAEAAVRASEERMRRSFEVSPIALALSDQAGAVLYLNRKFTEWFGYTIADIPDVETWYALAYPEPLARQRYKQSWNDRLVEATTRGGEMQPMEAEVTCSDGRRRLIEFHCQQFEGLLLVAFTDITERKAAEDALRASEEQFKLLTEHAPDAIVLFDLDLNVFISANAAAESLFGRSRTELLHCSVLDFSPPQQPDGRASEEKARELLAATAAGATQPFEWYYQRPDGRIVIGETRLLRLPHPNRTLIRGSVTDITERKAAEAAVRTSEERFRIVAEQTGHMIFDQDLVTGTRVWAGATATIIGYSHEELGCTPPGWWTARVHPGDLESFRAQAEQLRHHGGTRQFGYHFRRRDEQWIYLAESVTAVSDASSRPVRLLGTIADETARRAAEEAVRAGTEQLRLTIEQSGQLFFTHDMERKQARWAGAAEVITGYSVDFLNSTRFGWWDEQVHPDDRVSSANAFLRLGLEGGQARLSYRFHHKNGRWVHLLANITAVAGPGGRSKQVFGSIADITAEAEAAEAVRQLNTELEQRVRDRTAELARRFAEVEHLNTDLRTSQDDLAHAAAHLQEANSNLLAANQELESFSYSVSHDLRAPLRNIAGFIELLRKRTIGQLDPEADRYFGIIGSEAVRMAALIDDLLTFSRIGRAELHFAPVQLATLVAEVQAELQSDLTGRQIDWRIQPLPPVLGDRTLLRQVIANLLSNAVKFTRKQPQAIIEIGTQPAATGSELIVFYVRDNGAGFDPKYASKLFGVFQRLHNPRDFEGTGIGLANVRRIVERHGGRVWANGSPGQGATFHFALRPAAA
jgi:PAS domain S-box-containing protein